MKFTYEEILDAIKRAREDEKSSKIMEAIDNTVIEALEKQIPAKVKRPNKDDYSPCCPNCGTFEIWWTDGSPDAYCWKCGQKLDWYDE